MIEIMCSCIYDEDLFKSPDTWEGQSLALHLPDLSRHRYVHVEKKTPLFQNRYQPDMHHIVPVNAAIISWKIL